MVGQARMHELISEVSGHHLLLRHWVTERALIITRRVEVRALEPVATRAGESEDEEEVLEEELGTKRRGRGWGVPESLAGGESERRWWKGRWCAYNQEAIFPALPRRPRWRIGMGSA